jgi:hypothetical protein
MKSESRGLIIQVRRRFSFFLVLLVTAPTGNEHLKGTEEKISPYLLLFLCRMHKTHYPWRSKR